MKIAPREAVDLPKAFRVDNGLAHRDGVDYLVAAGRAFLYRLDERMLAVSLFHQCDWNLAHFDNLLEAAAPLDNDVEVRDKMLALARDGKLLEAARYGRSIEAQLVLLPLAKRGQKFAPGRKHGSKPAPLRAAIARALDRDPEATNQALWATIAARPPKGIRLHGTDGPGRHVEIRGADDASWPRFRNIASEERRKLVGEPPMKRKKRPRKA